MKSSARPLVLSFVLAGFGAFCSVWTVLWIVRESYLTAVLVALVTVWAFGFSQYLCVTALGAPKPRIEHGAEGVLLRPAMFVDVVSIVPAAAVSLAAALYLICSPLGLIDYTPTGVSRATLPGGCVALLLFSAPTMYRRLKYRGGMHLRLDPTGFEVWNGQWGSFKHGSWDEVQDILDHKRKGGKPFNELIVFVPSEGPDAFLYADAITDNSDALREWVRFYWQHPEYRGELLDERALQRLDNQSLTTG